MLTAMTEDDWTIVLKFSQRLNRSAANPQVPRGAALFTLPPQGDRALSERTEDSQNVVRAGTKRRRSRGAKKSIAQNIY